MRAPLRAAAVLGTAVLVAGLAAPAGAATPESSTLTAPKGTGTVASQWTGTLDAPSVGLLVATDEHELTVTIPGKAKKYFKKREAVLKIDLTWTATTPFDDLDLFVYDADGNEIVSSIDGVDSETVSIPITGSAVYTVEVDGFINAPAQDYEAEAFLVVT